MIRSFIVPPACGWGCKIIATGARGRGGGEKRASRRPSGPGIAIAGIILGQSGLKEALHSGRLCRLVDAYIEASVFFATVMEV